MCSEFVMKRAVSHPGSGARATGPCLVRPGLAEWNLSPSDVLHSRASLAGEPGCFPCAGYENKGSLHGSGTEAPRSQIASPERRDFLARTSIWSAGALALPLAGCESGIAQEARDATYTIDTSIQSPNQDSRVRTLVLHYTGGSLAESIAWLTDSLRQVSSHYLVPDAADGGGQFRVYALVPESRRAWHAGLSYWQGERMLNAGTIGIEVVNSGFPAQDGSAPLMNRRWYPYPTRRLPWSDDSRPISSRDTESCRRRSSGMPTSHRVARLIRGRCSRGKAV